MIAGAASYADLKAIDKPSASISCSSLVSGVARQVPVTLWMSYSAKGSACCLLNDERHAVVSDCYCQADLQHSAFYRLSNARIQMESQLHKHDLEFNRLLRVKQKEAAKKQLQEAQVYTPTAQPSLEL